MSAHEAVTAGIALLSLAISLWSLTRLRHQQKELDALEARVLEIIRDEADAADIRRRARITAALKRGPSQGFKNRIEAAFEHLPKELPHE